MSQITTKAGPNDLLEQMSHQMYREAYDRGMTLSAFLEREDPSSQYKDGLDAFGRILKAADVRTESLNDHGVVASTWEEFLSSDQTRALVPEWMARQWRSVKQGGRYNTRSLYLSDDSAVNTWERPYAEANRVKIKGEVTPAIPLNQVVGMETSINTDAYRAYYLQNVVADTQMVRITEMSEIPRVKLSGGETTINLHKYGRALEASYEQLRRQRLDKIALHIRLMAVQAEVDKLADAIDTMVNGDGNANTAAASYNLTTLDSAATVGTLSLKAWLAFKMKFENPYALTRALTREDIALQLMMLNVGSANVPLVNIAQPSGFGYFSPINPSLADNVSLGWTSQAPANKIVGFDNRFSLEMVTEIGGNIQEVERFVTRQSQALVLTEVVGWAIMNAEAAKILVVNA